jgi:regulator of ribosome biosynthesis
MAQALVTKLFALPSESVAGGRVAALPAPTTPLPREKPVPKAKALTKWQAFAQKKGIVKRKRSKLAWDEDAGEWKRRHGYKKANDDAAVPIIEARPGDEVRGGGGGGV